LIVGHNPGIQEFAVHLVGEAADDAAYAARERMKSGYPTAALAIIRFAQAKLWREVGYGGGELEAFTTPRDLKT
jgi:phosphohistidine phosphatase